MDNSIWADLLAAGIKKEDETYLEFADRVMRDDVVRYANPQLKIDLLRELLHVADGEIAA